MAYKGKVHFKGLNEIHIKYNNEDQETETLILNESQTLLITS